MNAEHERRLHATDDRPELIDRPPGVGERIGIDLGERLGAKPQDRPVGRRVRDALGGSVPLAPGLFSTTIGRPSVLDICSAIIRA